jgi:hypothetical protein
MTMLLHEPAPRPEDERAPIDPNWRVVGWLAAAVVIGFASSHATGLVWFVLVCAAVAAVSKAVTAALDYGAGLSEWRQ